MSEQPRKDFLSALQQDLQACDLPRVGLMALWCGSISLGLLASSLPALAVAAMPAVNSAMPAETVAAPGGAIELAETEAVRVVLRLSDRRVFLFQGEAIIDSYPVAVGAAATPTPQGQFEVSKLVIEPVWQSPWTGKMHAPGPESALGLRWIGFFSDASGAFGFHGTPTLDSIGKAVSNGCVRMRNEDVVALFSQVTIGTPVEVVP